MNTPSLSARERLAGRRHGFVTAMAWAALLGLVATGLVTGADPAQFGTAAAIVGMAAGAAILVRFRFLAELAAAAAVMTGALATAFSLENPASDLVLAVVGLIVVSVYRDWRLLGLAWAGTVLTIVLTSSPVDAVHGPVMVSAAAALLVLTWRFDTPAFLPTEDDRRLQLAFERAPVAMAMLKPSGEIVAVNHALVEMLGRDDLRLAGSNIRSVVHTDDRAELGQSWEEMANGESHRSETWARAMADDGSAIWCRMSLVLVPWDGEQPATVILQIEDMRKSHESLRELQELNANKDAFVASVLDEAAEALDMVIDLTADGQADLDLVAAGTREAVSILDMLRQSAHLSAGDAGMWPGQVDLTEVCRRAVGPWNDRVSLDVTADGAWADPTWLRQIVTVLIGHAVRFGGPDVQVITRSSGPDTVVFISDNGPALPEEERTRIFQSDMSNARAVTDPVAVGLGLTVSRRLARQMDGDVVYRREEGRNVLELRLPAEELAPADVA